MGVRDMIPALYIRLGRDQAAYDFMKWYATTGQDPRYNWGDIDLPFLDIKDGDVLESPAGMWTDEWLDLSHCSAVVLVKVRVLLDIQAVQNALYALGGNVPQEVIRRRLVGTIVESHRYSTTQLLPLPLSLWRTPLEACLMLSYNFAAWAETTGAIDMIKTLSQVV
ncbi:hypothetical protein E5D57_013176 [Metarhizium anisopliae]|nr:hypothetical protein E5D57_013176 [Metarhizium anisopliae]